MPITLRNEIPTPAINPEVDPFRYGWRYLKHARHDGAVEFEQVPLTLQDVLHPQVEDFIVHTSEHDRAVHYLKGVVQAQVKDDPSAVVLSDTRIAWDRGGVKPMGPDVALIFGVLAIKNWATFDCADEGARPVLAIEVTSPETGFLDIHDKLTLYEMAEIPWYIIVDYDTEREKPRYARHWTAPSPNVFGYHLGVQGFQKIEPNGRGWLWMEPAGIWIGIQDGHVQCYDAAGSPIGDYVAVTAALEASERALAQEREARLQAEERLAALEARLREIDAQ